MILIDETDRVFGKAVVTWMNHHVHANRATGRCDSLQQGFILLEVLVALLILSGAILGIVGMELSALSQTEDAYWYNLASSRAAALLERFRVALGDQAREKEFVRWRTINARLLPQGGGSYDCQGQTCTVHVSWVAKQAHGLDVTGTL